MKDINPENVFILDLETLSTKPNAWIVECGLITLKGKVVMDDRIGPAKFNLLRPTTQFDIDDATVAWHEEQNMGLLEDLHKHTISHAELLLRLTRILDKDSIIWAKNYGHGELPWLTSLFTILRKESKIPWAYNSWRELKVFDDLGSAGHTPHRALADCFAYLTQLQNFYKV